MMLRYVVFSLALMGLIVLGRASGHAQTDQASAPSSGAEGQSGSYGQGMGPEAGSQTIIPVAPRTDRTVSPPAGATGNPVDSATTRR